MKSQFYLYLGAIILLTTLGRRVWRGGRPKPIDWALIVAFIRLDFPPGQRDVAQKIAAGLAEIVGLKIKQLQPEYTLKQIAQWAENGIYAADLITLFVVAFGIACNENTTFRDLVTQVAERRIKNSDRAVQAPSVS
jgi:hypothetical protein